MSDFVTHFAKDECGATAIEYGLIAALIAIGIIPDQRDPQYGHNHDAERVVFGILTTPRLGL